MRRSLLLVSTMALALVVASGVALALPSETPDQTPMVNGTIWRAIEQVGTNVWLGGKFTQVKQCSNRTNALNVSNRWPSSTRRQTAARLRRRAISAWRRGC